MPFAGDHKLDRFGKTWHVEFMNHPNPDGQGAALDVTAGQIRCSCTSLSSGIFPIKWSEQGAMTTTTRSAVLTSTSEWKSSVRSSSTACCKAVTMSGCGDGSSDDLRRLPNLHLSLFISGDCRGWI